MTDPDKPHPAETYAQAIAAGVPEDAARELAEATQSPTFEQSEELYLKIVQHAFSDLRRMLRDRSMSDIDRSVALRTGMDPYHVKAMRCQYAVEFGGRELLALIERADDPGAKLAQFIALTLTNGIYLGMNMAYQLHERDPQHEQPGSWPYYG